MVYSLAILWHERQRFVPAVLAVAFSGLLVALQFGLLLGTFSKVSIPIDHTPAHLWVGSPEVVSVDVGQPVPEYWRSRLEGVPGVEESEVYIQLFQPWYKPRGGSELAIVVGSRLHDGALGAVQELTPELRMRLGEPGAVVVDESELGRLGLVRGVGELAQIGIVSSRVRVVGLVRGLKGLGGPYVFCSIETARHLIRQLDGQATYLLGRCRRPEDAPGVVAHLRRYRDMAAFTSREFSLRSRWHWLRLSGAGISLGCAALLGLLVGAVVTSQTLYAATAASFREYAVLRALGVPRWRLGAVVLTQSVALGVAGIGLALPAVFALAQAIDAVGAKVLLPPWVLASAGTLTLGTALIAGLTALRSLRLLDLAALLR
jgi:putative ABC transport system permease protein